MSISIIEKKLAQLRGHIRMTFLSWGVAKVVIWASLLVLWLFFSLATPSFATAANFNNILSQVSTAGILAVGMTFVLLTGEIDLSIAAVSHAPSHARRPRMISSDPPIWTRIVAATVSAAGSSPKCRASPSAPPRSNSLAMPLVQ